MKKLLLLFLIFLTGCASITPYLNRPQELHEGEAVILSRLLESETPPANFEAVREIAFRHNPDVHLSCLEIIAYHRNLGSLQKLPLSAGSSFAGGGSISSAMSIFAYASELVRKANPSHDPDLKVMFARFEKVKLAISQNIAGELSILEGLNNELKLLESLHKDKSIEQKINRFFESKGFSVSSDEEKQEDIKEELLKKKLAEKERIVRRIFELCGLVKK
ncbi:MAG: hypothetical protein DRN14_02735 [Thermoplasmata archaeon]|nr:MAG: hypothetical protein DRN14_02735 [Thermoplasmata archaeon]